MSSGSSTKDKKENQIIQKSLGASKPKDTEDCSRHYV
jgi:hypothetical protein